MLLNDDIDKGFNEEFDGFFKGLFLQSIGMVLLALVANAVLWGGLIFFALWCLNHFGVIG